MILLCSKAAPTVPPTGMELHCNTKYFSHPCVIWFLQLRSTKNPPRRASHPIRGKLFAKCGRAISQFPICLKNFQHTLARLRVARLAAYARALCQTFCRLYQTRAPSLNLEFVRPSVCHPPPPSSPCFPPAKRQLP